MQKTNRRVINSIISIFLLVLSSSASACSFAQMTEDFEVYAESAPIPLEPNFIVEEIERGNDDGNHGSCSDAGILTLKRNNKPSNPTGYIFEISKGKFEDKIFDSSPIKATKDLEEKGLYKFIWLDGSVDQQESLGIEVKIIAISQSGERSNPQFLKVTHSGTTKPWWKIW